MYKRRNKYQGEFHFAQLSETAWTHSILTIKIKKKIIYHDLYALNNKMESGSVWYNIGFQNQMTWLQILFFLA